MTVNEKIRDYIQDQGIKFKFVANKAGIPEKKFYRLINGQTIMSVDEFELICKKGLSVEPSFFLNRNLKK
ncbi:helix-turn-helix domain-containing protein [Fictibacillus gelatini]|uniref:helix-turn-helix domain-containing protein n=1 Tax=Fictibacillus gelatini TaxID=225985 RepID=UPI0004201989|nr:helix-turn-helix transcriptional regulator [Fictibacillus gelatini]